MKEQTRRLYTQGLDIVRGYLDGEAPFPGRLHLSVLFAAFQHDLYQLIISWTEFAESEISAWDRTDGLGMTPRMKEIAETLAQGHSALTRAPRPCPLGRAAEGLESVEGTAGG